MNKSYHNHPFHLVTLSPWPLLISINLMNMLIGVIMWFHEFSMNLMIIGFMSIIINNYQWWRDIIRESTFQGLHSSFVSKLLRVGMMLFIISELMFFFSFFWAFFHMSLSPGIEIGEMWPPKLITPFNPYNIPLLNTIILLTSGITITWSHYSILNKKYSDSIMSLNITIILGLYFTILQMIEYTEAPFSISDSVYGSTFFMITGFHGLHVIIGTLFIMISMFRLMNLQFSPLHHFGFEASSWYWHFVDVVWLFVYISIYWWTY
uniref:Cytochrome c oxidase subunit 3 n=1 Tax=Amblyjoppa sp. ZJUH_2016002 TaxID=2491150 RepID=A0A3Q8U9T9_9HYME|nr:cytochrome c oxidase subunit 3 [Amblyjoppa sp. ZJUH_2016002]